MIRLNRAARGALLALPLLTLVGCTASGQKPVAAVKQPQQNDDQRLQMARQYEREGKLREAEQLYSELLRAYPRNPTLAHRLGVVHTRLGDHPKAAAAFERAHILTPKDASLLSDMGYSEYLRGDLTAAAEHLEQALERNDDNKRAANNLGLVYAHQGRFDEALKQFEKFQSEAESLVCLAKVHKHRGEMDLAADCCEEALELDPKHESATELLAALKDAPPPEAIAAASATGSKTPAAAAVAAEPEMQTVQRIPDDAAPIPAEPRQSPAPAVAQSTPDDSEFIPAHEIPEPPKPVKPARNAPKVATVAAAKTNVEPAATPVEETATATAEARTEVVAQAQPAAEQFEMPSIVPGSQEPAVQPDASTVSVESGWQGQTTAASTEVATITEEAISETDVLAEPEVEAFEMPAEVAAVPEIPAAAHEVTTAPVEPIEEQPIEARVLADAPKLVVAVTDSVEPMPVGVGGLCPVSLRNHREMVDGQAELTAEHNGITYRFCSAEAREEFEVDPALYIPVAGGLDVVAVREGREVTTGSLEHATWFRDRLYLFASADTLKAFRNSAKKFADGY